MRGTYDLGITRAVMLYRGTTTVKVAPRPSIGASVICFICVLVVMVSFIAAFLSPAFSLWRLDLSRELKQP